MMIFRMMVQPTIRQIRLAMHLTPMHTVLRKVARQGVDLGAARALEVFGGGGASHLVDYASRVASVEVWEIEPKWEPVLRHNVPGALIRITDSFVEAQHTPDRFDWIVVDNHPACWATHCEHFELLPHLFRLANDGAVLVLNTVPLLTRAGRVAYPHLFSPEQRQRRGDFYKTDLPDRIPFDVMARAYARHVRAAGLHLRWWFTVPRRPLLGSAVVYYFVFQVHR